MANFAARSGLCCPSDSATRRMALINELAHGTGIAPDALHPVVDWLIANVDMAPKGTLNLTPVADVMKKHHGIA